LYNIRKRPYILGGLLTLLGYLWAMLHGAERTIPEELMQLRRNDQMQRLRGILRRSLSYSR
jgi:hypothetical protein